MSPIRTIFFDFDGVLVDSEPLHFECWAEVLAAHGIRFGFEEYAEQFIGVSNRAMVEQLCRQFGRSFSRQFFEECYSEKKALFDRRAGWVCRVPEQIVSFLVNNGGNYRFGVVSSSSRGEVEPYLVGQGVRDCLQALVCAEDVEKLKPAPDPYRRALEIVNVLREPRIPARECLVVEDSGPGEESARLAGMQVLRVAGPMEVAGELTRRLRNVR